MTEILRSGNAPFIPRARLLKLLGRELIRDEVMAIIELAKNAHDADASYVRLDFRGVADEGGEIRIEDDGHGMDVDLLLSRWMQPAASTKSRRETRYTPDGRRLLGEKGVGRFAVDRLGRQVELLSRRAGSDTEVIATFNWDEFDDESRLLSEVYSSWNERKAAHFSDSGTLLRVSRLRTPWTERTFRRLCTRLQRLLSPFQNGHDFRIEIASDEFPDYSRTLAEGFLDRSPYRITAHFDGTSTVTITLNDRDPVTNSWNGTGELTCGPVSVTMHSFDLESDAVTRVGPRTEVRAWLREWSGISIYRDGFRVLPYGEPDDDWLRLDQRRVNNPVVRLSNNQVCGFVEISRDANAELRDQTSRGGLIQSKAFEDLRRLVLFVIQILEAERQLVRHPVQSGDGLSPVLRERDGDERMIVAELKETAGRLGRRSGDPVRQLAARLEDVLDSGKRRHDAELSAYVDLAAVGQSAGFLHHSLRPRLEALGETMTALRKANGGGDGMANGSARWNMMENCLEEIREAIDLVSRVAPASKRRRRTIDVGSELQAFEQATAHLLADYRVRLQVELKDAGLLRADLPPETLQQVLHILLWNSLEWIGGNGRGKIRISAVADGDHCRIMFHDNGPGAPHEHADRIFQPRFSLRENGRGMGLAIARHLLSEYGATIRLLRDRRRKGASFEIRLRLKKSRATRV